MTDWKRAAQEKPAPYVNVFVVDPEYGTCIAYYNSNNDEFWSYADDETIRGVYWWMPITYPSPPEGSVNIDWD